MKTLRSFFREMKKTVVVSRGRDSNAGLTRGSGSCSAVNGATISVNFGQPLGLETPKEILVSKE